MIGKLILVAFMAFSMRTPKITPNPTDYEFTGGFEGQYGLAGAKFERENGEFYRGVHIKTEETNIDYSKEVVLKVIDGVSAELIINEAVEGMNYQYIYKNLLGDQNAKIRLTNQWTYWKDSRLMLGCLVKIVKDETALEINYDTNFEDRHITRLLLSTKFKANKFYVQPKYVLNMYDNRKDFQFKIEVGVVFGGGE